MLSAGGFDAVFAIIVGDKTHERVRKAWERSALHPLYILISLP
jgi:hypothetical protein